MSVDRVLVSLVLPVYNEAEVLEQTHARLRAVIDPLPERFLIYYVDDGSQDETPHILRRLAQEDPRIRILTLSRNFGHQAALTAGLDHAEGEIVISLDADGQHPPELIPEMIALIRQGYDIVQTQRVDVEQPLSFKRWSSALFYRLINVLSGTPILPGAADFRALSRQAVEALKSMPEYHRFLRGMVAWIGYRTVILPYRPQERLAGRSKYSLRKMLRLALDAIFSFSLAPLYLGLSLGIVLLFLALLEMIYVLSFWISGNTSRLAPGWSSLMFVILIVGGMLMVLLSFIGLYVGYIFQEVKRRPVYLLRKDTE
ncbi:MAG: glycosyltransferase [Chloroflexi bacterium]|nr:glycosyltransferase [Chloroflexota bacterium]